MLPNNALLNVTSRYDEATEVIVNQLGMSRTEAKIGMDKVIPILRSYENTIIDLNSDVMKLVYEFNNTYLDAWTADLSKKLMTFEIEIRDYSSNVTVLRNFRADRKKINDILDTFSKKHVEEEAKRD